MKNLLLSLVPYLIALISNVQDLKENALKSISLVEKFKNLHNLLSSTPETHTVQNYETEMGEDFLSFFKKVFGIELKTYIEEKNTMSYRRHSNFYYLEMAAAYLRQIYPELDDTTAYIVILVLYKHTKSQP